MEKDRQADGRLTSRDVAGYHRHPSQQLTRLILLKTARERLVLTAQGTDASKGKLLIALAAVAAAGALQILCLLRRRHRSRQ